MTLLRSLVLVLTMFGSMAQLITAKTDSTRVDEWLVQSNSLQTDHPDSAYSIASRALKESENLRYTKGIAAASARLGYIEFIRGNNALSLPLLYRSYELRNGIGLHQKAVGTACLISYIQEQNGNKDSAFSILFSTISLVGSNDSVSLARLNMNLGNLYADYQDLDKALTFINKAEHIYEFLKDTVNLGLTWTSLGNLYFKEKNYKKALHYFLNADEANRIGGDQFSIARNLNNIALSYEALQDYSSSKHYYLLAKNMYVSLDMKNDLALVLSNIGLVYYHEKYIDSALHYFHESLNLAHQNQYKSIILTNLDLIADAYASNGDYLNAFEYQKSYTYLNDSFLNLEKIKQIAEMQTKYEVDKKEQQIQLLDAKNKLSSGQRNLFIVASILGLLLAVTLLFAWRRTSKEKKRSDDLLLNILPSEVANELKATGKNEAKLYQNVTVLFTDFVGFTQVSQGMSPQELVQDIHQHFTAFDLIMEKHGLEKIKTIGDAYLAVCGLPSETPYHAQRVIMAAMDIIQYLNSHENTFDIRIGVNSGPVVAGIVGIKKFAYDIWDDTVNTAARMEQSSEPNRINISQSTFAHVSADFECTFRGQINAKNKGEISMYFIEGKKYGPNLGF